MRLVFLGSPGEVLAPLRALYEAHNRGVHELLAVVSQPSRAKGRRYQLEDPPVAQLAKSWPGIRVFQPEKASQDDFILALKELQPEVMITAAYGQILRANFLSLPSRATINIHPSQLPALRGATPVPEALLLGLQETAISILFTELGLDSGPIIVQKTVKIDPDETQATLTPRLFEASVPLLFEALERLKDPLFKGQAQDDSKVSFCKKISKEDGRLDFQQLSKIDIIRRFRAYNPWPGIYTSFKTKRVLLTKIGADDEPGTPALAPGAFAFDPKTSALNLGTAHGVLKVYELKLEGGKAMPARAFINGLKKEDPRIFGE